MKKLKSLVALIVFVLVSATSNASHMTGATIWYKNAGKYKYDIYVEFYRDCRGIPFNAPTFQLRNASTGSNLTTPSLTRIAIEDITPLCKNAGKPCSPQNQTISGGAQAYEKHTYKATVDMNSFKTSGICQVQIGAGQCCRNGAITTGASGNDFWVYSMVDLCKAPDNNSPVFGEDPILAISCNSIVRNSPAVSDYTDNDSLAYELVNPISNWTSNTTWAGGFSTSEPFSVYWPSGYNKSKGPDPKASTPIGFYFNKLTGEMVFVPTSCSETTILALRVSEYRKDSATGKYNLVGFITRDFQTTVFSTTGNNIPTMTADDNIYIPDNIKSCFTISSNDKAYVPPPPAKTINNDTTSLIMFPFTPYKNTSISFKILDTKAKLKKAEVCWEPKGLARNQPYQMVFKVTDNHCDYYGSSHKTVNVYVIKSTNFAWVEGRTFYDKNKNCLADSSEAPLSNQRIVFGANYALTIDSDSSGYFQNAIPEGNYTFKIYDKNNGFVCTKSFNTVKGNRYNFNLGAAPKMHITGTLYKDSIKNCKLDTVEYKWANHTVYTDPGNYATTTDANGFFDFKIPAGNYALKYKPKGANYFVKCSLPMVSSEIDTLYTNQNIAIFDSSNLADASTKIISAYHYTRNGNQEVTLIVKNNGSQTITSGSLWFKFNKKLKLVSASSYISKTDSTINWSLSNIAAGNELRFYAVLNADASTCQLNDTMTLQSWLDTAGIGKDVNPTNNYDKHKLKISGKTDPNLKTEFLSNGYAWREGNTLRYFIQFRNTGKKSIKNIWVIDTIPYPIAGSSIQMLGASHANTFSIVNNVLRVDFSGINLPDSTTDKIKSKGYFEFSADIDPRTNSELKFFNKAEIYFDTAIAEKTNKFYTTYTSYVSTGKTYSIAYCLNDSLKVSYNSNFKFNSGNKFHLILSDVDGTFGAKTTTLDSVSSTSASGNFKIKIPASIAGGYNYKLKIVSTKPYSKELSNGVSNAFKIFAVSYKPIIATKDSFVCGNDSILFSLSSEFDTVKIYDRKTLIGKFGNKGFLKLKLKPGKHYLIASIPVSSSCVLSSDTLIVRNDTLPKIKLVSTTHPSGTACDLDSITLKATGAVAYTFYDNIYKIIGTNTNGIYKNRLTDGNVIRVIGKALSGCSDTSNDLAFVIYPLPYFVKLTISDADLKICKGESVTFTGSGADTFQLFKNNKPWLSRFMNSINSSDISDKDTIKLVGKNDNNCTYATKDYIFTVNPLPTVVITCTDPDLTLCDGVNNNQATFNFAGANTYKIYKNGAFLFSPSGSTYTTNGIKDKDKFYVEGTNTLGCKNLSNTITIRVKNPVFSFEVNKGGPVCDGDSVRFDFTGGISYELFKNKVTWQTVISQKFVIRSVTQADTIYAKGTDSFGCKANSAKYGFNIVKSPIITIADKFGNNSHCEGKDIVLTLTGVATHDLYKNGVLWKPGLGTSTTFNDLKDKDELYATGKAANGCKSTSNTIKFTIWPIPAKPIITQSGKDLFSNYTTGNQWSDDVSLITGAINRKFTPPKFANYYVKHTSVNGCESPFSDAYKYSVSISKEDLFGLKIYPNPTSDYIRIETGEAGHFKIKLRDITGKLIKEDGFIGNSFELNFKLEKGIYQLVISNEKGQIMTHSLVVH